MPVGTPSLLNSQRSNYDVDACGIAITNASANGNSPDFDNLYSGGAHFYVNVTQANGTTPSLIIRIQEKDPVSGTYSTLLQSAAIIAPGFQRLTVAPGATVTANVSANDFIGRTWRIVWIISGTTPSFTATIGASFQGVQGG